MYLPSGIHVTSFIFSYFGYWDFYTQELINNCFPNKWAHVYVTNLLNLAWMSGEINSSLKLDVVEMFCFFPRSSVPAAA